MIAAIEPQGVAATRSSVRGAVPTSGAADRPRVVGARQTSIVAGDGGPALPPRVRARRFVRRGDHRLGLWRGDHGVPAGLAGQPVALLERGRELHPGQFPRTVEEAGRQVQIAAGHEHVGDRRSLYTFHVGPDLNVFSGCGLGGRRW